MNGTLPEDNILYYIAYAIILVAFYVVLKSPKKDDGKKDDEK